MIDWLIFWPNSGQDKGEFFFKFSQWMKQQQQQQQQQQQRKFFKKSITWEKIGEVWDHPNFWGT